METHFYTRLLPLPITSIQRSTLYETLAITHYIDTAFDGPALRPPSPLEQAHMLRWVSIINAYVFPTMNRFIKERLVRSGSNPHPRRSNSSFVNRIINKR